MTSMELLEILGSVKDKYVAEAHSETMSQGKRVSVRRTVLIAAIIALMLLLVGCVAAVLGLQDLWLGNYSFDAGFGQTQTGSFISLQGYAGSPGYQAAKEWQEFVSSYDTDGKLLALSEYDDYVETEEYRAYTCYTPEMQAKIDELCEKYGLKRLSKCYLNVEVEEICEAIGIESVFARNAEAEMDTVVGYYYEDGSFTFSGNITLTGENAPIISEMGYQYLCIRKDSFLPGQLNVGDMERYEQWQYTMKDGTKVLLALSADKALILADKETCFASVNILNTIMGDAAYGEQVMDKTALEAVAEVFDFSYTPQTPDIEAADRREAERQAVYDARQEEIRRSRRSTSYADYLLNYGNTDENVYYTLLDMNGDGVEELAYWYLSGYNKMLTMADGWVAEVDEIGVKLVNGYTICQAETGEYVLETSQTVGEQNYLSYLTVDGTQLRYAAFLKFDPVTNPQNPWFVCTNAPGNEFYEFMEMPMYWENVTLEEFGAVRETYPVAELLSREPIQKLISGTAEDAKWQKEETQNGFEAIIARYKADHPDKELECRVGDFDGNGWGDLAIWYDDAFRSLYMMGEGYVLDQEYHFPTDGFEFYEIYYQGEDQISYEGNLLGTTITVEEEMHHYFYWIMDSLYIRECVKYDPNGTDSKWFRGVTEWMEPYETVTVKSWEPITEYEYHEILCAYQVMAYNRKPIDEYYLR